MQYSQLLNAAATPGEAWRIAGEVWHAYEARRGAPACITVAGYGACLRVERDALVIHCGPTHSTDTPADVRIERGARSVDTIVLMTTRGSLSLDAIQWCADQRVAVLVLDRDGNLASVVQAATPAKIERRRRQYTMPPATSLDLARRLVARKLTSSIEARPMAALPLHGFQKDLGAARSIDEVRLIEGRAAGIYWAAWTFPLHWKGTVPESWAVFTQRTALNGTPRHAVHPVNAMLNYGYAVLAGHIERAIVVRGLDPAVGVLHTETTGRNSLTYDLIESLRAPLDARLLPWIEIQRWTMADFTRDRAGVVRLHPQLARVVVQQASESQRAIDEVVDWYIRQLV